MRNLSCSAGFNHTLLLAADGSVFAVGRGDCGRLGFGDEEDTGPEPRKILSDPCRNCARLSDQQYLLLVPQISNRP